jgi:hypothetical protein
MKNNRGSVIIIKVTNSPKNKTNPIVMTFFGPILSTIHPQIKTEKTIVKKGRPLSNPVRK